ncbi:MAG: hypothetical protein KJ043_22310 [Anaerolineae bacterium]|nr:hypothetical protein [Anaerolineae bacterium]
MNDLDPQQQQQHLQAVRELLRLRATAVSVGSAGSWTIAKRIMPKATTFEDEMKPIVREAIKAEKEEKKFLDKYSTNRPSFRQDASGSSSSGAQSFRGSFSSRPGVRCFICSRFGHMSFQCPNKVGSSSANSTRPRTDRFRKLH